MSTFQSASQSTHVSQAIPRVVAMVNQKGGVGKTTTLANIGGLAALKMRVLMIDLDPQGNLFRDIGYDKNDGRALLGAILGTSSQLPILKEVRPNLDVVPGGIALASLGPLQAGNRAATNGHDLGDLLFNLLDPISDEYDLILIDTPPGDLVILEAALEISKFAIIPTRSDDASIDGVELLGNTFAHIKNTRNPELVLAGVIMFAIGSQSRRIARLVRDSLESIVDGTAPVFETRVRYQETVAIDARRRGKLFHELEEVAATEKPELLKDLRSRTATSDRSKYLLSSSQDKVASEFEKLTQEVLLRIQQVEAEETQNA